MKILNKLPAVFLVAGYFLVKITDFILYPLKDLPEPDFNHEYDSTML